MPAISTIVNVTVTNSPTGIISAGFGIPLILSADASWPVERTRTYTSLAAVGVDFATTTHTYKAANAVFSQNPRPAFVVVGRITKPTQKRTITPTVVNSAVYSIRVGTATFSYTSDADATAAEIVAGLIALINAGTDNLTATGTTTLVLTANSAGAWDDVQVLDPALLSLVQDHADPGIAADLTAILNENQTWYTVVNPFNSSAMATAIAAWAEANERTYLCDTQDSEVATVVEASATDIAKTLKTSAYKNTAVIYHPSNGAFAAAAWAGRCLHLIPGSETWAHKTLAGVAAVTMTDTQRANVLAKNASTYQTVGGVNVTNFGKVPSGEYFDITRLTHWTMARIRERAFGAILANDKLPMTDEGLQTLGGAVRSVMQEGEKNGGFRKGEWSVFVPRLSAIPLEDRNARHASGVTFNAPPQGAIHTAAISGVVAG